ncbi:MAG: hypothetical protein GY832_34485 [Chloroflexi bacterium]|nr:hypothetical protein [Chloroflexota bacterium]
MDTPNRSQRNKFPKPRGWAMNWVFEEMEAQLAEQRVQESRTGARKKFTEPQGWAMKWDGSALPKTKK